MKTASMMTVRIVLGIALAGIPLAAQQGQDAARPKLYNTAKQKLLEGKQVFSFTQSKFDIAGYCEAAKHYDYTWFEMQHSTLEFKDIEAMIAACPHAGATPMIRLPDAQEWHIQHATDIGALGVIVPTVDDVDRAREAAKWSRYPPVARRSAGQGQAASIWGINGINYRQTINDNMLVVVMIETPTGVANAYRHRVGAGRGRGDHRQQRSELVLRIPAERRPLSGVGRRRFTTTPCGRARSSARPTPPTPRVIR